MDFKQQQSISQSMRQEQTMSHQQIQALEMLNVPVLELDALVLKELEKNPVLATEESELSKKERAEAVTTENEEWLDKILKLDEGTRYIRSRGPIGNNPDDEEKRQHFLDSFTVENTLQDVLLEQLRFLDLEPTLKECCETIISGLDDDGYLSSHPADLAMVAGVSIETIEEAIKIVQSFEPTGVAARNLQERLLLQLQKDGREDTPLYTLIENYLEDIARNHLPQVAKKMRISLEELKELVAELKMLNPTLPLESSVSPHEYVSEEVTVYEDEDGELKIKLHNEHLPSLFISKKYRDLLEDPNTTKETADYIKGKLKAGTFLINSIIQRQTTIKKIMSTIVELQRDFFLKGKEYLKPMTMAQVAERVGIHETTVSRAVANKYLRCKYGLLPIRQFFSSGYTSDEGEEISKNTVQDAIKRLIDQEDKKKPLSDSKIVKLLEADGIKVARRTVAKYRDLMNILPSNLRREY